jgi:hypothetical protein
MLEDTPEDCWEILNLAPDVEVSDIHRAFEQLRLLCLPKDRDRAAPLSAETKARLQQLDRAFFLALDSKNTKFSAPSAGVTAQPEPRLPFPEPTAVGASAKKWALSKKKTSEQTQSIASEDLVSPQQRGQALGGLTPSFANRALGIAHWMTTRLGTTLDLVVTIFLRFSRLHFALRAVLGGALGLAVARLFNTLSGHSAFNSDTAGNAILVGIIFGLLTRYRWWLLGLVLIFLYERYAH